MKVYLTGAFEHMDRRVGYGNASYHIYNSLKELGIDVHIKELNSREEYRADIEIAFDQPNRYSFMCPTSYKIGYTPWESTEFIPNWWRGINGCDEIWTTSNWCYSIFRQKLPEKKLFTYSHGIDHRYKPKKRSYRKDKPFTFLFIGEPYYRKDGTLAADTFAKLFGNNPDYRLIIKCSGMNTIKIKDPYNNYYGSPEALYENIYSITEYLSPDQMIELYDQSDVFVYPTWGEGFGFNPLQALAMGIPVISTADWSDYAKYITLPISSSLYQSPWPEIHPGYMMKPNHSDLKFLMKYATEHYDEIADQSFKASLKIHEEFDWIEVSKPAAERLRKIHRIRELKGLA